MCVCQSVSLQHYTGYDEETVAPVVLRMLQTVTEERKVRRISCILGMLSA